MGGGFAVPVPMTPVFTHQHLSKILAVSLMQLKKQLAAAEQEHEEQRQQHKISKAVSPLGLCT